MQRIFPLMILSVALLALPATAMPLCSGKTETCQAAREAAKLFPADRRFAAECAKCWRDAWAREVSVGGRCEGGCGDVLEKIKHFH
jgi:hypothetical protein